MAVEAAEDLADTGLRSAKRIEAEIGTADQWEVDHGNREGYDEEVNAKIEEAREAGVEEQRELLTAAMSEVPQ